MLSNDEAAFIRYWEANRLKRKRLFRQFLVGIPLGLLIVIPTVISLTSGWYKRAEMEANSSDFNPMVLLIALLVIVGFTAIFHQRWKWEQYEQRYLELLAREDRETPKAPANPNSSQSVTNPDSPQSAANPNPSQSATNPNSPEPLTPRANSNSPQSPLNPTSSNSPGSDPNSPTNTGEPMP